MRLKHLEQVSDYNHNIPSARSAPKKIATFMKKRPHFDQKKLNANPHLAPPRMCAWESIFNHFRLFFFNSHSQCISMGEIKVNFEENNIYTHFNTL